MIARGNAREKPRLRIIVADDEPLALQGIVELLATDPSLEVAGAFESGPLALAAIEERKPDIVMLDIRMPGLSGLDVVTALEKDTVPAIIFVTAYDRHAVQAFEANAIDYVLKPFTDERFFAAIERAKQRLEDRSARSHWEAVRPLFASQPRNLAELAGVERLIVRSSGKAAVVRVAEIDWIEGADYYARLHFGGRSALIRESLASLEKRLDSDRFFRISKSAIVSLERVVEVRLEGRTEAMVILRDGTRLRLARGRRAGLEEALERPGRAGAV